MTVVPSAARRDYGSAVRLREDVMFLPRESLQRERINYFDGKNTNLTQ